MTCPGPGTPFVATVDTWVSPVNPQGCSYRYPKNSLGVGGDDQVTRDVHDHLAGRLDRLGRHGRHLQQPADPDHLAVRGGRAADRGDPVGGIEPEFFLVKFKTLRRGDGAIDGGPRRPCRRGPPSCPGSPRARPVATRLAGRLRPQASLLGRPGPSCPSSGSSRSGAGATAVVDERPRPPAATFGSWSVTHLGQVDLGPTTRRDGRDRTVQGRK